MAGNGAPWVTDWEYRRIIQRYTVQKQPVHVIAEKMNRSRSCVYRVLREANVYEPNKLTGRHAPVTDDERKEILRLYDNGKGMTMRQVSASTGRSRGAVNAVLTEAGATMRKRGGVKHGSETH